MARFLIAHQKTQFEDQIGFHLPVEVLHSQDEEQSISVDQRIAEFQSQFKTNCLGGSPAQLLLGRKRVCGISYILYLQ